MKFAVTPFLATLALSLLTIAPTTTTSSMVSAAREETRLLRTGNNDHHQQEEEETTQDVRNLSPSSPPPIAVTAWWVLFHKPEKCAGGSGACSPPAGDVANRKTKASVFYCAGGFTDPTTGDIVLAGATFKASKSIKDVGVGLADLNPAPEGAIDRLFSGGDPEVLLVIRTHGEKVVDDPAMARAQIMGFDDPICGTTPENTCANTQMARFVSGEEGEKSLIPIGGDGTPVAGSSVFLNRQGDALQTVIKTTVLE